MSNPKTIVISKFDHSLQDSSPIITDKALSSQQLLLTDLHDRAYDNIDDAEWPKDEKYDYAINTNVFSITQLQCRRIDRFYTPIYKIKIAIKALLNYFSWCVKLNILRGWGIRSYVSLLLFYMFWSDIDGIIALLARGHQHPSSRHIFTSLLPRSITCRTFSKSFHPLEYMLWMSGIKISQCILFSYFVVV